jgi:hypothetical protein
VIMLRSRYGDYIAVQPMTERIEHSGLMGDTFRASRGVSAVAKVRSTSRLEMSFVSIPTVEIEALGI